MVATIKGAAGARGGEWAVEQLAKCERTALTLIDLDPLSAHVPQTLPCDPSDSAPPPVNGPAGLWAFRARVAALVAQAQVRN